MNELPVDAAKIFAELAVRTIRESWRRTPRVGIILGTGLGHFATEIRIEAVFPYETVPGFPKSTALGHRGRLICGVLEDVPVVAMEGRCHLYEGYSWNDVTLPVRVMRDLGADVLIASNASGGVNPQLARGDIVVLASHINLMGRRGMASPSEPLPTPPIPSLNRPYDPLLLVTTLEIARRLEIVAVPGVYVAMLGPNYETRAEYRLVRRIGGDVVGMSTVPESVVGASCGFRVLGLSVVTNVARPDSLAKTSGLEVAQAAEAAEARLGKLVRAIVLGTRG